MLLTKLLTDCNSDELRSAATCAKLTLGLSQKHRQLAVFIHILPCISITPLLYYLLILFCPDLLFSAHALNLWGYFLIVDRQGSFKLV